MNLHDHLGLELAFKNFVHRFVYQSQFSNSFSLFSFIAGKLYSVIGKRGGRILHGDLREGSTNFEVTAQLPVVESFDFANEVRRQTSGLALPQLVFSGWEVSKLIKQT